MPRVVVIGAGAAGTMAAIFAAAGGAQTQLLERTSDGGRKILISGGGRCNVLPTAVDESRFVTESAPHILRQMIRSWPLAEQIAFFESDLGIPLAEEKESGKFFPASNRARDVRDGLLALAVRKGVTLMMNTLATRIEPSAAGWRIDRMGAPPLEADALIMATGGLSVPNTGSDGLGLRCVEGLGHSVHPTYAALTPLIATPPPFGNLAGISLQVTLTARAAGRAATATGGFLFTHRGYSGPAVLDISHVAVRSHVEKGPPARIVVRWTPLVDEDWELALRPSGSRTVGSALRAQMPARLASALLGRAAVDPARTLSSLRRDERLKVIETLVRGELL